MFVHARSGAASFAACLRLFRSYPLAVTISSGWQRSIVLRHRAFEGSGFFVLTQDPAGHFTLRPWNPADGECHEIRPGASVPVISHRVITEGLPVPRDGALLGWVSDRQTTVLLSVYHGGSASPGGSVSSGGLTSGGRVAQVRLPQVRVLAQVGSEPIRWPPFTVSPLDDGRFWEYAERGEIVDLAPVVVHGAEVAFWVPSQNPARASQGHGCVVVSRNLRSEDFWVPEGIYMDHWMLREGVPTPPASHLLALPGATGLSRRLTAR